MTVPQLRRDLAAQIPTLTAMVGSPLLSAWYREIAEGRAIDDATLEDLVAAGYSAATWSTARKLGAAVVADLLRDGDHALLGYVPILGGSARVDRGFDAALTRFAAERGPALAGYLSRLPVQNDPQAGLDLWRCAQAAGVPDWDLLCVGAGAGLELVAEALDPSLRWHPVSRRATDLDPIDLRDDTSRHWLLGQCPPEDTARFTRTTRAIEAALASGLEVEQSDAVTAIASAAGPLVVSGASVLCMFADPTVVTTALRERSGATVAMFDEVVSVHRRAGVDAALQPFSDGDRVLVSTRWSDGRLIEQRVFPALGS